MLNQDKPVIGGVDNFPQLFWHNCGIHPSSLPFPPKVLTTAGNGDG